MEIYLVRHPRPCRSDGFCYGRMDLPVDLDALAATVTSLRSRFPADVLRHARIFTSPASRCLGLARELAAPGEPGIVEALQEMHFGTWEGLPWEAIPRLELDAWAKHVWTYRAGGGESAAMVAARWHRWTANVAAASGERRAPVIAVTHAGLIRVALAAPSRRGSELSLDVPFGSVHRVEIGTADLGAADTEAAWALTP